MYPRVSRPECYPDVFLPVFGTTALVVAVLLARASLLIPVAACFAASAIVVSSLRSPLGRWSLALFAVAFGLLAGSVLTIAPRHRAVDPVLLADARVVTGRLVQDASVSADTDPRFLIQLQWIETAGARFEAAGTVVVVAPGAGELSAGRVVRVEVGSVHPMDTAAIVRSGRVEPVGWVAPHFGRREVIRQRLFDQIDLMGYRAGGLFRALITGSRAYLSRSHQAAFRESGSSHLLALSGMHLGIVAAIVFGSLRFLIGKRAAFVVTLVAALAYVYLAGMRPSLLRALVMLALVGTLGLWDRRTDAMNVLALTVGILVVGMPSLVHELSFQLSALSILGIISPGRRIRRLLSPWMPRGISAALAAAAGAQLMTAPLTLLVFGVVHPVAVVSSLLLIPMVTLFVWSGLLWLGLTALLPALAALPVSGVVLSSQAGAIHRVAGFFAQVPAVGSTPAGAALVTMVTVGAIVALYTGDVRKLGTTGSWPPAAIETPGHRIEGLA